MLCVKVVLDGVGVVVGVIKFDVIVDSLLMVLVKGSRLGVVVLKNVLKLFCVVVLKVRFKFWL